MSNTAEILLFSGLLLVGIALYFLLPAGLPYFILTLGFLLCVLGGLGIVKGIRK